MVCSSVEGPKDPVAEAHRALQSETGNLADLANWCEDNFKSIHENE